MKNTLFKSGSKTQQDVKGTFQVLSIALLLLEREWSKSKLQGARFLDLSSVVWVKL